MSKNEINATNSQNHLIAAAKLIIEELGPLTTSDEDRAGIAAVDHELRTEAAKYNMPLSLAGVARISQVLDDFREAEASQLVLQEIESLLHKNQA